MDDFATGYLAGQDGGGGNRDGGFFGSDGIWAILLFAMIFGWGRGGYGNGDNGGGVTRADMCSEFNFNDLQNGVRGIQQGICATQIRILNSPTSPFFHVIERK